MQRRFAFVVKYKQDPAMLHEAGEFAPTNKKYILRINTLPLTSPHTVFIFLPRF